MIRAGESVACRIGEIRPGKVPHQADLGYLHVCIFLLGQGTAHVGENGHFSNAFRRLLPGGITSLYFGGYIYPAAIVVYVFIFLACSILAVYI